MTNLTEPREAELPVVTLARMEGKLDGIVEKVADLRAEVTDHRRRIGDLQSVTQQLESDAKAASRALIDADRGRDNTAKALKEADEARVAAAKEKVDQSTASWTPVQRLALVAGLVLSVVLIYLAFRGYNMPAPR